MEKVQISTEFITLGQFLKYKGIISFGGDAKEYLKTNKILINGELEERRGRKLYPKDIIKVDGKEFIIDK